MDPEDRDDEPETIEMAVEDVLDLHSFPPREVKELVRHYLDLAVEAGFSSIRIIHGRGTGVQREIVRSQLQRDPRVESFGDAPAAAGGWGATWARLVESGSAASEDDS